MCSLLVNSVIIYTVSRSGQLILGADCVSHPSSCPPPHASSCPPSLSASRPPSLPVTLLQLSSPPPKASALAFQLHCPDLKHPCRFLCALHTSCRGRGKKGVSGSAWSGPSAVEAPRLLLFWTFSTISVFIPPPISPLCLCMFWPLILWRAPPCPRTHHSWQTLVFFLLASFCYHLCEGFSVFKLMISFSKCSERLVCFNTHHMILSVIFCVSISSAATLLGVG